MAVCRRCGKSFDYDKRDGVCPKCCFYNRPAGTWQEDESWIKNYNYEDNSYDVTLRESTIPESNQDVKLSKYLRERDANDVGGRLRDVLGHKEMDGSHTHLENGKVVRGSGSDNRKTRRPGTTAPFGGMTKKKGASNNAGKTLAGAWFFIIIVIYYIIGMFLR